MGASYVIFLLALASQPYLSIIGSTARTALLGTLTFSMVCLSSLRKTPHLREQNRHFRGENPALKHPNRHLIRQKTDQIGT